MNIISYSFILIFLPISIVIYWGGTRKSGQKLWFLCILSYLFYALAGNAYVILLLGLSLLTFLFAQRRYFAPGILINLLVLAIFKYWNFGINNVNMLLGSRVSTIPLFNLALPLGISFYVFKHIGYLLDVRSERYAATHDLLSFVTFSAFFPQISAGPLSNFEATSKQLRALPASLTQEQFYVALIHFSVGLAKKVLIADILYDALQAGLYNKPGSGILWSWLSVFLYTLQIYFDFSGYTDMMLGLGYLFGVTLPPNFNNPYLSKTPSEFWQRWHISLSNWFRIYLYFPLSRMFLRRLGGRRRELAQYMANLVVMPLIGLWHGAGWGFLLWGIYHGLLLNLFAVISRWQKLYRYLANPFVIFIAVLIGWGFFLSPSGAFTLNLFQNMFGIYGFGSLGTSYSFKVLAIGLVASLMVLLGCVEAAKFTKLRHPAYAFMFGVLVVFCVLHLETTINFVYVAF